MVAQRTSLQNAFETELTSDMGPTDLVAAVASKGSLTSPCLLIIDPDSDSFREVIRFDGTFGGASFVTSSLSNRYGDGSAIAQIDNHTHTAGTKVRSTPLSQHFDDLHDRIDAIDHGALANLTADDHTQYILVDGSRPFTGAIGGVDPVAGSDLATKDYVDSQVQSGIQPGLVIPYAAAAAPSGFLLCDGTQYPTATYPDLFAAIGYTFGGSGANFNVPDMRGRFPLGVAASGTGSTLGETGGSLDHTHTQPTHSHTAGSHTHDMGSHSHSVAVTTGAGGSHSHTQSATGSTGSHSHTGPSHTHSGSSLSAGTTEGATVGATHASSATAGLFAETTIDHDHSEASAGTHNHGGTGAGSHSHDIYHRDFSNATEHTHSTGAVSGNTGSGGTGATSTTGSHSHTNPTTTAAGSHDHSVATTTGNASGTTGVGGGGASSSDGDEATGGANPPYMALAFIIKT